MEPHPHEVHRSARDSSDLSRRQPFPRREQEYLALLFGQGHDGAAEHSRPLVARRKVDSRVHSHNVRTERRRHLRAVPSNARMAS